MSEQRISYDLTGAAETVGVSERSIRDALRTGDLVAHHLGRKPLILHRDLVAWVESMPTDRPSDRKTA